MKTNPSSKAIEVERIIRLFKFNLASHNRKKKVLSFKHKSFSTERNRLNLRNQCSRYC